MSFPAEHYIEKTQERASVRRKTLLLIAPSPPTDERFHGFVGLKAKKEK
ncbi:MAG: hypothetical protein ACRC3H_06520 [Lachnospiraceae bacterium]